MNSKLESIGAVVKSLEENLNKVQSRVETLEQDQAKSKVTINEMHDGLQALNTIVKESRTAADGVKKYCDDKYKELQDKILYAEVFQWRKISALTVLKNCPGGKEDARSTLLRIL